MRLLSNGSPIKNILVRNISGLAEFYGINGDCWRFAKGNGVLENIIISNMNVSKLKDAKNTRPLIIINSKVRNFVLDNFSRNADGALSPSFKLDNNSLNAIILEGLSPEQVEFGDVMKARGYLCQVAYRWQDAYQYLIEYAGLKKQFE